MRIDRARTADRGLFLCYVFYCGSVPCAAITGVQHDGTYYLYKISKNETIAKLSPDVLALHFVIEDLIRSGFRCVDLGYGMPRHGKAVVNVIEDRAYVVLLRNCFLNRFHCFVHSAFHKCSGRIL
jgi:CelD/BcsL family acetyltransferase involved in cellulose biosynthesis